MNHYQATGVLMQIELPNEAEAKKGKAGKMVIRYGGRRDSKGNSPRQYVNAVPMRIPSKLVKNFRPYQTGQIVEVMGRLEGILERSVSGGQFHSAQLVANTIKEVDLSSFGFNIQPAKPKEAKPPVGSTEAAPTAPDDEEAHEEAAAA